MDLRDIKESGLLELYVIGDLSDLEIKKVEHWISLYPEISQDIFEIEKSLEQYAFHHSIAPNDTAKPFLITTLDYSERVSNGEEPTFPPALGPHSKLSDFQFWLDRPDMVEPQDYESMHGKIIGASEERSTLIVWLKHGAPDEIHTDEIEKFLVVEGTCDIIIGNKKHSLIAGDFLSIPLHINHRVEVTSKLRCKVILERAAA